MRRAIEMSWQQFVAFCGRRVPCERLALEFVRRRMRRMPSRARGERASSMLAVIETCLRIPRLRGPQR